MYIQVRVCVVLHLGRFVSALEGFSEEMLWDAYTGGLASAATAKPKKMSDVILLTYQTFEKFLNLGRWRETRLTLKAMDSWLAMHQRSTASESGPRLTKSPASHS